MSEILFPETMDDLVSAVESADTVLPVGRCTKDALSANTRATLVSVSKLTGIIQYEPSEFTFTARAGTTVSEVAATLAKRNQYLPFDPLMVDAGATLGGTVASGISGPGRVRYGGLRDFLLGVRFLSGDGKVINAGGKVVKNAAGFDIPKLLVGSLGRLGVMTELTFKVFPLPLSLQTYCVTCDSDADAIKRIGVAARSRWELDAIDYRPHDRTLWLRIGGPEEANDAIADDMRHSFGSDFRRLQPSDSAAIWNSIGELNWPGQPKGGLVVKVPITPEQFLAYRSDAAEQGSRSDHLSAAGAVLWVAVDAGLDSESTPNQGLAALKTRLADLQLSGLVVRGPSDSVWLGPQHQSKMASDIKLAMDPARKFPDFLVPESAG